MLPWTARSLLHAIVALWRFDRDEQGLKTSNELLDRFAADDDPEIRAVVAGALIRKAAILALRGRTEEATPIFAEVAQASFGVSATRLSGAIVGVLRLPSSGSRTCVAVSER